jgi:hypothetical protein
VICPDCFEDHEKLNLRAEVERLRALIADELTRKNEEGQQ